MKPDRWAKAVRVDLLGDNGDWSVERSDARLLIEQTTKSVFLSRGPRESFSNLKPTRRNQSSPDELTIDDLFGSYDPRTQTIEIYCDQIAQHATLLGHPVEELVHIVRLHEYAHAIVHMGVPFKSVHSLLSQAGAESRTDWRLIIRNRTRRFHAIPEEAGELLAQSITLAALGNESGLHLAFEALEKRQPLQYRVPEDVKNAVGGANWPFILKSARGEVLRLPNRADRREAFEKLICAAA